jgi:hypothetical protein
MKNWFHSFHDYWIQDVSFVTLLVMLLFTIFVLPTLIDHDYGGVNLLNLLLIVIIIIGIGSANNKTWILVTSLLVFAQVVLKALRLSGISSEFYLLERVVLCFNLLAFMYINVMLLFRDHEFNSYRVVGGINVYLLFAFLGAFLFELINLITGSSIQGPVPLTGKDKDYSEYIYYSLTSLTTVGYGDYIPVNRPARMLSVFLSSVGMLFPAIIIARLVSLVK